MELLTQVQILDEAICISGKGIDLYVLPSSYKYIKQTSLASVTSLIRGRTRTILMYKNIIYFFSFPFITKCMKSWSEGESWERLRYTDKRRYRIFSEPLFHSSFTTLVWVKLKMSNPLSFYVFQLLGFHKAALPFCSGIIPIFDFSEFYKVQTFLYISTLDAHAILVVTLPFCMPPMQFMWHF